MILSLIAILSLNLSLAHKESVFVHNHTLEMTARNVIMVLPLLLLLMKMVKIILDA
jgi:hypothetical protein